jgi:hypothetical protein
MRRIGGRVPNFFRAIDLRTKLRNLFKMLAFSKTFPYYCTPELNRNSGSQKLGTSYAGTTFEKSVLLNSRQNGSPHFRDGEGFSFVDHEIHVPALRSDTVSERVNLTGSPTALDSRVTEERSPCSIARPFYRFMRRPAQNLQTARTAAGRRLNLECT